MYNIFFYILFITVILSSFYIAFGRKTLISVYSLFIFFAGISGVFALLNSELFSLLRILTAAGIILLLLILFPKIQFKEELSQYSSRAGSFPAIIIISILTALTASLVSSTRWDLKLFHYEGNTLALLFTKYLPMIILAVLSGSVILTSLNIISKERNN